ncbi:hypothetical protein HPB48_009668 [Haemaphysalis longicornis]|uniref:Uncharacterized protein n=1 Tax=Haemaphysalis longicornis TaxID=44386 RepID=A0A9J6FBY9_HAELO|nr:hypothetical protein HPB48_009668 [Haemaphysalis longicornis]
MVSSGPPPSPPPPLLSDDTPSKYGDAALGEGGGCGEMHGTCFAPSPTPRHTTPPPPPPPPRPLHTSGKNAAELSRANPAAAQNEESDAKRAPAPSFPPSTAFEAPFMAAELVWAIQNAKRKSAPGADGITYQDIGNVAERQRSRHLDFATSTGLPAPSLLNLASNLSLPS